MLYTQEICQWAAAWAPQDEIRGCGWRDNSSRRAGECEQCQRTRGLNFSPAVCVPGPTCDGQLLHWEGRFLVWQI